jgi:hypothetical protein
VAVLSFIMGVEINFNVDYPIIIGQNIIKYLIIFTNFLSEEINNPEKNDRNFA